MNEFTWSLRCGEDSASGHEPDIAHAIAALHRALDDLVTTADGPEVEGMIAGPDVGTLPFWINWGPLEPTHSGDAGRDVPRGRMCIEELTAGIRAELHRIVDRQAVAAHHYQ